MTSERSLTLRSTEPLVAILLQEDGQEFVRYFPEGAVDAVMTDDVTRAALAAIGACSDLDWDEWAAELDRIRDETSTTPPAASFAPRPWTYRGF